MTEPSSALAIVINGVPRSGKTSLAAALVAASSGNWVIAGVDSVMARTPEHLQPGIGLRPGGERPDLEPLVLASYQELFRDIGHHLGAGVSVVADVGIHDDYSQPLDIMGELRSLLAGRNVLFVGLHCSLDVLRERREQTGYLTWQAGEPVPDPVLRWQHSVHRGKQYELELDTTAIAPGDCAAVVLDHIRSRT